MTAPTEALAAHYQALETKWSVIDRSSDYSRLVVPSGNADEPIHRWFKLKEAYSLQLLPRIFKDASFSAPTEFSILDPFVGSGTTLLSAVSLASQAGVPLRAVGIERNPFIHVLASAKVAAATQGAQLISELRKSEVQVQRRYTSLIRSRLETESATLNNEAYFSKTYRRSLLALARAVDECSHVDVRNILRVCVASSVESAGRLRRDGRALRFVPERRPKHPLDSFKENFEICVNDLATLKTDLCSIDASVLHGDGRYPDLNNETNAFDFIIFSPPYPNNIDYTEVYKTEAWTLGLYASAAEMKNYRLASVRSHPSIQFPESYSYRGTEVESQINELLEPLLSCVPKDRYDLGRRQVIQGYADDMHQVLVRSRKLIKETGRLIFVVGNSAHATGEGRFVIAADLLMCALAEMAGWIVEEIRVARWPVRRGGEQHLRESVVSLRPAALGSGI